MVTLNLGYNSCNGINTNYSLIIIPAYVICAGTIPSAIGNLTSLNYLYLNNNYFIGTVQFYYLFSTAVLMVILGTIPSTIGMLTNLLSLWLSFNSLKGK